MIGIPGPIGKVTTSNIITPIVQLNLTVFIHTLDSSRCAQDESWGVLSSPEDD